MPEKFNAFNFTFYKLGEYVHGFCKKMAKAKMKKIPEMSELSSDQMLAILMQYVKDQKVKPADFSVKTGLKPLKDSSNMDDDKATYQKSVNYFKESEKRNSTSEIYIDKKHKKKLL